MNDDGAWETLYPYAVTVRGCAGDLIVCGLASVTAKHAGGALAVVNGNPCGFRLEVKEKIRFHWFILQNKSASNSLRVSIALCRNIALMACPNPDNLTKLGGAVGIGQALREFLHAGHRCIKRF